MKLTTELLQQLKSAAQEEIMCREASDTSDAWQDLAIPENILLLVEIALPVLEQQEMKLDLSFERENFELSVMKEICISKATLEGLRTEDGYRNSTLSGKDYNGMWETWIAQRKLHPTTDTYRQIENDGREG